MECKLCEQEHNELEPCKLSRRRFFFLSSVAAIGVVAAKVLSDDNGKYIGEDNILYKPTQKQIDFLYGGTAGGGKSELIIRYFYGEEYPRLRS